MESPVRPSIGVLVTYFGLVEAPFDKEADAFICPSCKQALALAQKPTPEEVLLICMTDGCKNHVFPVDYERCYEIGKPHRMKDVSIRSGQVRISTSKVMQEIIEAHQDDPPENTRLQ